MKKFFWGGGNTGNIERENLDLRDRNVKPAPIYRVIIMPGTPIRVLSFIRGPNTLLTVKFHYRSVKQYNTFMRPGALMFVDKELMVYIHVLLLI